MQSSARKIRSAGESSQHVVSIIQPSPNELNNFHQQQLDASTSTDDVNREGLYNFLHDDLRISSDVANSYCNSLQSNGYDDVSSLEDATEQDLKDMGVKIGHIRRIKRVVSSTCMRNERHRKSVAEVLEESMANRKSLEGSLLSDYARQEMVKWSPSPKDRHVDLSLVDAREFLIRKQAEKIASLEAKLASFDIHSKNSSSSSSSSTKNQHGHDEWRGSLGSRGGGSVDASSSSVSKKLTPEERLQAHKERKEQENKYKEKTGVWEPPPPLSKEKSLTKKVTENDDLVLKLTSDPTQRKKIDELENITKKANRKMLRSGGSDTSMPLKQLSPSNRPPLSPSSKSSLRRASSMESERQHHHHYHHHHEGTHASHSTSSSPSRRARHHHKSSSSSSSSRSISPQISCQTCGSNRDCEEDIDNPGTFYCKSCWDEYETSFAEPPHADLSQSAGQVSIEEEENDNKYGIHHALWVVHDNPQLGQKIIYSGPRRMECMIETKDPHHKNCVRIVIGDIDYSGKVKHAGIGNMRGNETDLGAECIRIRNARGFYVDHGEVESRLSKDKSIYEMHLDEESAHILTGKAASKSVADFFQDCNGAIDIILDPQRDFGGWYPQREASSGGRKIAPQFRSKGVGYIRLGDDMGVNGLAFLSSDSCHSFLLSVPTTAGRISSIPTARSFPPTPKSSPSVEDDEHEHELNNSSAPPPPPPSVSVKNKKTSSHRHHPKPPLHAPSHDDSDNSVNDDSDSDDDEADDDDPENALPNVSDVLKQLQSPDMAANMKWKDKAELLSYLGQGASREDGRHVRSGALNIIQDTLGGKNVNVHVIRSALIASGMIGIAMGSELASQTSWKAIMIETMKLLKSKQCGSVAKTVLAQLHGRCFTLTNTLEYISHVLGMGSVTSASKSRKSRVGVTTASPKPRRTSVVGGNNVEIIEWLAEITEKERNSKGIDPILEKSSLVMLINLFLSHVDHRDQRCRKNVMNGLMQAVLYGVQRLGLDLTRVMRMCSGLKETNPKGWNKIYQNAQSQTR